MHHRPPTVMLTLVVILLTSTMGAAKATSGLDVLKNIAPDGNGLEVTHGALSALRKNNEDLELTAKALATYEAVTDLIGSMDLRDVFTSTIPVKVSTTERLFSLSGARRHSKFVMDNPRLPMNAIKLAHPWDFAMEFPIKQNADPIPGEKLGYGMRPAFKVDMGTLDHRALLRLASGLLRLISPKNLEANQAKANPQAFIFEEFNKNLPETFGLIQRYLHLNPNIEVTRIAGNGIAKVDGEVTLKVAAVKQDYPILGEYLERLMDLEIDLDMTLRRGAGINLMQLTANTGTRTLGFTYLVHDGQLIPTNDNGTPLFDQGFAPDQIKSLETSAITNVFAKVLGLKFQAKGVQVDASYKDGVIAEATGHLTKLPQPVIEGRLFGILPDWAIDFSIPGNMEEYMRTFSQGLLLANKGEGSVFRTRFDTSDPAHHMLNSNIGTEIVDNLFLGLGLKVVAAYLWPSSEVIHEGRTMMTKYLVSLEQDFAKLIRTQQKPLPPPAFAH